MSEVTERIKELVELLPAEVAREVERLLVRLTHGDEDWQEFPSSAFAALFDDTEVEYTEDDIPEVA